MAPELSVPILKLPASSPLVVAVSGGSDSLALLMLAKDFSDRTGTPLLAVTIDHRLRPAAAVEARNVAALCAEHGIAHRTLAWTGAKPATGLIAAAREARYDLLRDAAQDFNSTIVLTGHTLDDQAETVAMRAMRGSGAGLSGMSASTLFDGQIWILRPLLSLRRGDLRAYLRDRKLEWIDDPSNDNPDFERVRIRSAMTDAEVLENAARATLAGKKRREIAEAAASLIDKKAMQVAPGLFALDPSLSDVPSEPAVLALRALLATIGGTTHLPDVPRVQQLLGCLVEGANFRATLSRTVIDRRRSGIWLLREARDIPQISFETTPFIWDGRWRFRRGLDEGALVPVRSESPAPTAPESLVRSAAALQPNIGAMADGPHGVLAEPVVAPYHRFMPDFDLPLASALGRLVGAPPLPASPWKHHIEA